jgi:hypothetical protein
MIRVWIAQGLGIRLWYENQNSIPSNIYSWINCMKNDHFIYLQIPLIADKIFEISFNCLRRLQLQNFWAGLFVCALLIFFSLCLIFLVSLVSIHICQDEFNWFSFSCDSQACSKLAANNANSSAYISGSHE